MSAYKKTNERELKRIAELRAEGQPFSVIGARIGITENSARYRHRLATGAFQKPRERKVASTEAVELTQCHLRKATVMRRSAECLPAQHPETWGAVVATFSAEWRSRFLDA